MRVEDIARDPVLGRARHSLAIPPSVSEGLPPQSFYHWSHSERAYWKLLAGPPAGRPRRPEPEPAAVSHAAASDGHLGLPTSSPGAASPPVGLRSLPAPRWWPHAARGPWRAPTAVARRPARSRGSTSSAPAGGGGGGGDSNLARAAGARTAAVAAVGSDRCRAPLPPTGRSAVRPLRSARVRSGAGRRRLPEPSATLQNLRPPADVALPFASSSPPDAAGPAVLSP